MTRISPFPASGIRSPAITAAARRKPSRISAIASRFKDFRLSRSPISPCQSEHESFAKTGFGGAALHGNSPQMGVTFTTLGARFARGFPLGQYALEADATLGYRHAFGTVTRQPMRTSCSAAPGSIQRARRSRKCRARQSGSAGPCDQQHQARPRLCRRIRRLRCPEWRQSKRRLELLSARPRKPHRWRPTVKQCFTSFVVVGVLAFVLCSEARAGPYEDGEAA